IIDGAVQPADFANKGADRDHGDRPDAIKLVMPSGSLAITKGTLWHRGGANRSDRPRLIITPQYCAGWLRQLENMVLAVPADIAKELPERARELIGYSIHPAFMGHVDGGDPNYRLADYFDYVSGTSTGGIIAAGIAMGMSVADMMDFYVQNGAAMFDKTGLFSNLASFFQSKFKRSPLAKQLKDVFGEDTT